MLSLTDEQREDIMVSKKEIERGFYVNQKDLDQEIDGCVSEK